LSTWAALYERGGLIQPKLQRLGEALRPWPADAEWQWCDHEIGVFYRPLFVHAPHPEPAPSDRTDKQFVAFDGRLDNRDTLIQRLRVSARSSDGALVLAAYRQFGERSVGQLEGDFGFCLADSERGLLLIARDVVGLRPVYYRNTADGFYCSSRLEPLLGVGAAEPDWSALARFLCWPHALTAQETLLRDVHALPPATAMLVNAQGHRTWKYWEADGASYEGRSRRECEEAFRALLQQSIHRRLRGVASAAVQVSGGVDSSTILCVAQSTGPDVFGVYHGNTGGAADDETKYLAELERGGSTIQRVGLLPSGFPELTEQTVRQSEFPFVDDFPGATARALQRVRELGARVVLNGTWADQLLFPFPPGYLIDAFRGGHWLTVARHVVAYPAWMRDVPRARIWQTALRGIARAYAPRGVLEGRRRRRLQEPLALLLHEDLRPALLAADGEVESWSTSVSEHARSVEKNVRSRIDTMSMEYAVKRVAADEVDLALPYLDRDVLTLLVTVPPLVQMADATPKSLLRNAMHGIVPEPILQRRDKGDYSRPRHEETRKAMDRMFDELRDGNALRAGLLDEGLFAHDLSALRNRLNIAEDELAPALARVYGVECWLRNFGIGRATAAY
jgi:asparagine synthase (glutamine-hydrolysing)